MKQLLTFLLIFSVTFQFAVAQLLQAQAEPALQENNDFYNLKHKRHKKAAWICLGGGTALIITGLILKESGEEKTSDVDSADDFVDVINETGGGKLLTYIGGAATVASVPFFISAGKNKRKATLHLKKETLTFVKSKNKNSQVLSVAVTIDL